MGLPNTVAWSTPEISEPVLHAFSSERRQALGIPAGTRFYEESTFWNPSWTFAKGAIQTTDIVDMTTTAVAVGEGTLLSPESHQEQIAPDLLGFGKPLEGCPACHTLDEAYSYGLGVVISGDWILQNPLFGGYGAVTGYLPAEKIAVAVATTFGEGAFDEQGNSISSASPLTFSRAPQAEAPQPVPVLGLGEERFDPDLPFAHRLGVGLGRVVGAHPSRYASSRCRPTRRPRSLVVHCLRSAQVRQTRRGGVDAPLRALAVGSGSARSAHPDSGRYPLPRRRRSPAPRTSRPGGRPPTRGSRRGCRLPLDGGDVLDGAVLGVAGHLARPQLPAKARSPEQVERRLVLLHLGRGDQGGEDDPRPAAIDDVVVLVAQARAALPQRHRRGVGSVVLTRKSAVRR